MYPVNSGEFLLILLPGDIAKKNHTNRSRFVTKIAVRLLIPNYRQINKAYQDEAQPARLKAQLVLLGA